MRVREGAYDPTDIASDEVPEPKGRELWTGSVEDITVMALRGAGIEIEPGEWYEFGRFSGLIEAARPERIGESEAVYSTVTTRHAGVGRPWDATIGIEELTAALMVCRSVIGHVRRLGGQEPVWVRVE